MHKTFWSKFKKAFLRKYIFCTSGIPDDVIEKGRDYKLITEVIQNGDEYSWTQHYPAHHSVTNKFIIGKECDMETIGGKKFKVWLRQWICTSYSMPVNKLDSPDINVLIIHKPSQLINQA